MKEKINEITDKKICVLGDIMLDKYIYGKASKISPEAPIPIVLVEKQYKSLGGSANVASNIRNLNLQCLIIGRVGLDDDGKIVENLLSEKGINYKLIRDDLPTISKTRVISSNQQMIRLDVEKVTPLKDKQEKEIIEFFKENCKDFDIVLISDYAKGFCTENLCHQIIQISNKNDIKVIIDPKKRNWKKYEGAYLITPNHLELIEFTGKDIENKDFEIENVLSDIYKNLNIDNIIVTRAEKGMSLYDGKDFVHIPAVPIEVFDVSGAGDCVISVITSCLSSGYSLLDSAEIANKAASIVVQKAGTVPITYEEFINIIEKTNQSKTCTFEQIKLIVNDLKRKEKKIVFTNGCFDILHAGHIKYLEKAKELGDVLIIGLNSDSSVQRLKGKKRPLQNQTDRAYILSALECVNYIVIFDDDTPLNLIKIVEPDILVKGGDYNIEDIIGREYAKQTITIPFIDGKSTSNIIKKIQTEDL